MSRKRILMVIPQLGYGGAEGAFIRLANYLSREADVTIALMAANYSTGNYSTAREEIDLPFVLLDGHRRTADDLLAKIMRWWRMLHNFRRMKRDHDMAISFLSGANLLNALAGPKHKTIVSERGSKLHHVGISARRKFLWLRLLDPLTYRLAGKVVVVSEGYATEVMQIAGRAARHKVISIEGPIDAKKVIDASDSEGDPDIVEFCRGPVAVYCGRLDRGKGIDLLISSFATISRDIPNAKFLIIGDGPLYNHIEKELELAGLEVTKSGKPDAKVFLAGYRERPLRHYRLASVYLFPSLHEGLGNALIEAVSTGIPILASDCPWGPRSVLARSSEQVSAPQPVTQPLHLPYGTLMPLPDSIVAQEIWAREIATALQHPGVRRPHAECYEAIMRFDIEETGPRWLRLCDELVPGA